MQHTTTSPASVAPASYPVVSAGPGRREFVVLLAMTMAMTALAMDVMLPAFPDIREAMGLPPGSTDVSQLVTAFFLGLAVAQVPAGILSDHFGRTAVLRVGLVVYALGALATLLAPSLGWMLAARFAWGIGAAAPRVTAVAIVRDRFSGDEMARVMSLVMTMFLLVPVVAPAIGSALLVIGPWQTVFAFCAVVGLTMALWMRRLPETLPVEDRRSLRLGPVLEGARTVLRNRQTVLLMVAMTAAMAALMSYIASAELFVDEVLGLEPWFALVFGGLATGMGIGAFSNSRLVGRYGMWTVLRWALISYVALTLIMFLVAIAGDGTPSPALVLPLLALILTNHSLLVPNLNAAAMEPMGRVAGTAAALIGAVTIAGGSLVGALVDRAFDGTLRPLATVFAASGVVALGCFTAARRAPRGATPTSPSELEVPPA
ncbi:MAG: multidrug effflux MFS transporter [Desertimonas sp.]